MPTTNPVPSNDPTDLLFNAQKLDQVVNGSTQYYTDRLGVNRRTVEGISAAADVVLGGLGYAPPVAYASGISLTLTTQTVEYSGEVYAPKVGNLPFTTSGTFEAEKFRLIQGVSSVDLSASSGSALVGYDGGTVQDVLDESKPMWDYVALRAYTGRATGIRITKQGLAGFFARDASDTTSADNGGTIIMDASGRRWKRDFTGPVNIRWFGASSFASPQANRTAIQKAMDLYDLVFAPDGTYLVDGDIRLNRNNVILFGESKANTIIKAAAAMTNVIAAYGADNNPDSLLSGIGFREFTVDGNGLAAHGLFVSACLSPDLYVNVDATGCTAWGINHNRGFTNTGRGIRCHTNFGSGALFNKEVNQCLFDVEADNNAGNGIVVCGADGLTVLGGAENNGEHGFYAYSSQVPNIHALNVGLRYVENNGTSNKSLYSGIRLGTASPANIMQGIEISPHFLNISGESGIHIGPNIQGITIGEVVHTNSGSQQPLVLASEYIDIATAKTAAIKVSKGSNITPSTFAVETASAGQTAVAAEYVFESLDLDRGLTFSPTILTGNAQVGRAYSLNTGTYTKIGDRILFSAQIAMSAKGSSTGVLEVSNLPYVSAETTIYTRVQIACENLTYTGELIGLILPGTTSIRLYQQASGAGLGVLSEANLPASGLKLYLSGSYRI